MSEGGFSPSQYILDAQANGIDIDGVVDAIVAKGYSKQLAATWVKRYWNE